MSRTETITRTLFIFDELTDEAKEKAREWWRESDEFDEEHVYEDAEAVGARIGIAINTRHIPLMGGGTRPKPTIYYSGFCSQGDGACFEGSYKYAPGGIKAIKAYAGTDEELHRIARELQAIQRKHFYKLTATTTHRGHYFHSRCMQVQVERDGEYASTDTDDAVEQLLRDFADWIYSQLEKEYTYRMSDEHVDDSIRCNAYEFTESGHIA